MEDTASATVLRHGLITERLLLRFNPAVLAFVASDRPELLDDQEIGTYTIVDVRVEEAVLVLEMASACTCVCPWIPSTSRSRSARGTWRPRSGAKAGGGTSRRASHRNRLAEHLPDRGGVGISVGALVAVAEGSATLAWTIGTAATGAATATATATARLSCCQQLSLRGQALSTIVST